MTEEHYTRTLQLQVEWHVLSIKIEWPYGWHRRFDHRVRGLLQRLHGISLFVEWAIASDTLLVGVVRIASSRFPEPDYAILWQSASVCIEHSTTSLRRNTEQRVRTRVLSAQGITHSPHPTSRLLTGFHRPHRAFSGLSLQFELFETSNLQSSITPQLVTIGRAYSFICLCESSGELSFS